MNVEVDSVVFVLRLALTGVEAGLVVDADRLQRLIGAKVSMPRGEVLALAAPKAKVVRAPHKRVDVSARKNGHRAAPKVRKGIERVPCAQCGVLIASYRQGRHKCRVTADAAI